MRSIVAQMLGEADFHSPEEREQLEVGAAKSAGCPRPESARTVQQMVRNLRERSQRKIGIEMEKEHFRNGKPKDKTPGAVADAHLRKNPNYYPVKRKPEGSAEALRWVKEHCGHCPASRAKQRAAGLRARRPGLTHRI